jgi:hypothetical protein
VSARKLAALHWAGLVVVVGIAVWSIRAQLGAQAVEQGKPTWGVRNLETITDKTGGIRYADHESTVVFTIQHRKGHCFLVVQTKQFEQNKNDIPEVALSVTPAHWEVCHP